MCISKQHPQALPTAPPLGLDARAKRSKSSSSSHKRRNNNEFIVVQHHYHDHSDEPITSDEQLVLDTAQQNATVASFPMKLFLMLEQVEADGFGHIVSWQPHGRCFCVHDTKGFQQLLSRYFSLSKVSSFQRQLNLYDFTRLTRGRDKGGYYNEFFLRGRPHLLAKIQRIKVKGTGVRARSNPEQEPDFWHMEWVGGTGGSLDNQNHGIPVTTTTSSSFAPHVSSHASIVSHDESSDDEQEMSTQGTDSNSNMCHSNNQNLLLCGWGKPFYYLDSLPPLSLSGSSSLHAVASNQDFLHSLDMDHFLESAIDIVGVDTDEDAFGSLLEQIVS